MWKFLKKCLFFFSEWLHHFIIPKKINFIDHLSMCFLDTYILSLEKSPLKSIAQYVWRTWNLRTGSTIGVFQSGLQFTMLPKVDLKHTIVLFLVLSTGIITVHHHLSLFTKFYKRLLIFLLLFEVYKLFIYAEYCHYTYNLQIFFLILKVAICPMIFFNA